MTKRNLDYKKHLDEIVESLKHKREDLDKALEAPVKVLEAAKDMTQEELTLINAYVKSDLKEFAQNYQASKQDFEKSPFYLSLTESMWQGLLEITDRTQVEWLEVFQDFEHKGIYQVGEVIGLGTLVCEKCGHHDKYNHATVITPCSKCGNDAFSRLALKP